MLETLGVEYKHWNMELLYLLNGEDINDPTKRLYSEHSEEIVIKSVFDYYKSQNRWCVDVGACGIRSSNTYRLITEGWSSLQIETDKDKYLKMKKVYEGKPVILVNKFVTPGRLGSKSEPDCLESILLQNEIPKEFDFLNIDIDGYDYEIWKNLESFSPNLICIECNQFETNFNIIEYDPSFDRSGEAAVGPLKNKRVGYGGATVGLLNKLAEAKGYTYLCLDVSNVFYIKNSFIS